MRTSRTPRSSLGWIIGLLVVAFLTTGMMARSIVRTNMAEAGEVVRVGEHALNIAYLADPQQPQLDLAEVRRAGISVANSAVELQIIGERADGIMVDSTMLTAVDHDWLVAQRAHRKLIIGVNVSFNQLAAATASDLPPDPGSYRESWPGKMFYSLLWHVEQDRRMYESTGSDFVQDTASLLGTVRTSLDGLLEARNEVINVHPTPAGAPTRPPTR